MRVERVHGGDALVGGLARVALGGGAGSIAFGDAGAASPQLRLLQTSAAAAEAKTAALSGLEAEAAAASRKETLLAGEKDSEKAEVQRLEAALAAAKTKWRQAEEASEAATGAALAAASAHAKLQAEVGVDLLHSKVARVERVRACGVGGGTGEAAAAAELASALRRALASAEARTPDADAIATARGALATAAAAAAAARPPTGAAVGEARSRWLDAVEMAAAAADTGAIYRAAEEVIDVSRALGSGLEALAAAADGGSTAEASVAADLGAAAALGRAALAALDQWQAQCDGSTTARAVGEALAAARLSASSGAPSATLSAGAAFEAAHKALDADEGFLAAAPRDSFPRAELLRAGRAALAEAEAHAAELKTLRRGVAKAKGEARDVWAREASLAAGKAFAAAYQVLKEEAFDAHDDADDKKEAFVVAENALAKAQRRGGAADPQAMEAAKAAWEASKASLQAAQRALERERAALVRLTSSFFPEFSGDEGVAAALADLDPELAALECPERRLEMYTELDWTEATAPGESRHAVRAYTFAGVPCVLKTFDLSRPSHLAELKRQARLLGSLDHSNVAPITAIFFDEGKKMAYIETPFYENGPLDRFLARAGVAAPRLPAPHATVLDRGHELCVVGALAAFQQLAAALAAVHAMGAVHGDVKLPNVLVNKDGAVVLNDFDFASIVATATFSVLGGAGTLLFMAPEVSLAALPTAAADVYGWGVCVLLVFYQPDTGVPLGPRDLPAAVAALRAADPTLGALVGACLAEDPAERPTAAGILQHEVFSLKALRVAAAEREALALEAAARAVAGRRMCCVCAEEVDVGGGVECGRAHFTCAGCLGRFVREAISPAAFAVWATSDGSIICPVRSCGAPPLAPAALAKQLPAATYERLESAQRALLLDFATKQAKEAAAADVAAAERDAAEARAAAAAAKSREEKAAALAKGEATQAKLESAKAREAAAVADRLKAELDERLGDLKWESPGEALANGAVRHKIPLTSLATTRDTREQREFNIAVGHFARLLPGHTAQVRQVDVFENARVVRAWRAKKLEVEARVGPQTPIWVFHGTAAANLERIMTEGFKVGGRDVGVANGSRFGKGVYTATGPATPLTSYGHGTAVILAVAVEGAQTPAEAPGSDSWAPNGDWVVFRDGAQLLPRYVLHM